MTEKDIKKQAKAIVLDNIEELHKQDVQDVPMDEGKCRMLFIGTVFRIMPSGKFYMPWACSNVEPCPRCKGGGTIPNKNHDAQKYEHAVELDRACRRMAMDKYGSWFEGKWPAEVKAECDRSGERVRLFQKDNTCSLCNGVGSREAYEDEMMQEWLHHYAQQEGCYVTSGEGDPCDLFLCESVEEEETEEKGN